MAERVTYKRKPAQNYKCSGNGANQRDENPCVQRVSHELVIEKWLQQKIRNFRLLQGAGNLIRNAHYELLVVIAV